MYMIVRENGSDRKLYELVFESEIVDIVGAIAGGRCQVFSYELQRFLDAVEIKAICRELLNEKMYSMSKN